MMTITDDDIRALFNLVVASMDFGSGFLCDEDVITLRRVARALGVDPDDATPSQWSAKSHGAVTVETDHVASGPDIGGGGYGGTVDEDTFHQSWCLCGFTAKEIWNRQHKDGGYAVARGKVVNAMAAHVQEMLEVAREGEAS